VHIANVKGQLSRAFLVLVFGFSATSARRVCSATFEGIVRLSLYCSLGARVRTRLPRVLFPLGRVRAAFSNSIVSFKETANTDSLIQPALQFLNVETRSPMLAEACALGISFHSCLESLCRKTRPSCARVLWMGLNHVISAAPNRHAGLRFVGVA
jgi:hypothetical protein